MKYLIYPVLLLLMACGGKKKAEEQALAEKRDSLSRPENVSRVSAIARVEPAEGLIELAAPQSGIVNRVYKKAGDSVKKGDPIIRLDAENEELSAAILRKQILTQQSRAAADATTLKQFQAELSEKERDLRVSEKLALTGAETRENVAVKQKERAVLQANLQNARNLAAASRSEIATLQKQLQQAQLSADDQLIRAKQSGVLVSMDAEVGTAVTALSPFASIAPEGELILHGEIDEMFSSRVKIGQRVAVNYVGNQAQIAQGKVVFLSPVLDNKSLFYEEPGETSDRRVRRFKVALDANQPLLINAKVECNIQIK